MAIRVSIKIILILLVGLVLVTGVTGGIFGEETIYEVTAEEALLLFGNGVPDHDEHPFTDDKIEDIESEGFVSVDQLLAGPGLTWERPAEEYQTWNKNSFEQEHDVEQRTDRSTVPDGVDGENSDYIKHAHSTIYSTHPATKVHTENGTHYRTREEGYVANKVDFLVEVPEDRDSTSSAESFINSESQISTPRGEAQSVSFSLREAEVVEYNLYVDGVLNNSASPYFWNRYIFDEQEEEEDGPDHYFPPDPNKPNPYYPNTPPTNSPYYPGTDNENTHTSAYTFEFDGVDGEQEIEIVATIETEIEATIEYEYEETVTDEDGNEFTVTRESTSRQPINDDITLGDEFDTIREDYEGSTVEIFELPDGEMVSIVETPQPYSRFEIAGGESASGGFWEFINPISGEDTPPDEIHTDWEFTTTRDASWDQARESVEVGEDTETELINTTENPIRHHVFPSGQGPTVNETEPEDEDEDVAFPHYAVTLDEEIKEPAELPIGISENRVSNYTDQTTIETQHMRDVTGEDLRIYGFVDDEPYEIPGDEISFTEVKEGNITVEVSEINRSRDRPTELNVSLTDEETGEPINMDMAGGEVTITDYPTDRSIDLGSDGETTIRANTTGTIYVEYEPPAWTESDLPTTGDVDYTYKFVRPSIEEAVEWAIKIFIRLIPLLLVLYMITALREMFHTGKGRSEMGGRQR